MQCSPQSMWMHLLAAAPWLIDLHPLPPRHTGFFLMLGSVGFRASLSFVRHIYKVGRRALACRSSGHAYGGG